MSSSAVHASNTCTPQRRRPGLPCIVMLHEGLGCVAMWRHFPERVVAVTGCRVLVWSRAGYGHSQPYVEASHAALHAPRSAGGLAGFTAGTGYRLTRSQPAMAAASLIFAGAFPEVPLGAIVMAPHELYRGSHAGRHFGRKNGVIATDMPQKPGATTPMSSA